MTLKDLMEQTGYDNKVDSSLPQDYFNDLVEMGLDPTYIVCSYQNSTLGEPVNVAEKWLEKYHDWFLLLEYFFDSVKATVEQRGHDHSDSHYLDQIDKLVTTMLDAQNIHESE